MNTQAYKYDEIKSHFDDFLAENSSKEWLDQNIDELHDIAFNQDYYIIGTYDAIQWLGGEVFEIINIIKEYENDNYGEVATDFSSPERVVNMYAYIIGEQVVNEWVNERETEENKLRNLTDYLT